MGNINVDEFIFSHMGEESNNMTRARLQELIDMGCEEIGTDYFGIKGVFSGLYIEKVWGYSDEDWNDYVNWAKNLIKEKSL